MGEYAAAAPAEAASNTAPAAAMSNSASAAANKGTASATGKGSSSAGGIKDSSKLILMSKDTAEHWQMLCPLKEIDPDAERNTYLSLAQLARTTIRNLEMQRVQQSAEMHVRFQITLIFFPWVLTLLPLANDLIVTFYSGI